MDDELPDAKQLNMGGAAVEKSCKQVYYSKARRFLPSRAGTTLSYADN